MFGDINIVIIIGLSKTLAFFIYAIYYLRNLNNISFYFARAIINEGCFVVTDIDIDHEYGKNSIYIECKPRYLEDEYRNWLLNKAYFLRDLDYTSMPKESYILDSMLRTYAREGKMPDVEKVKKAWGVKSK